MTHLHYPLGALLSPRGKWVVDNRSGWDVGWASSAVHFNSSQFYSTANLDNKSCQSRSWFYWEARVYLFLLCYSAYSRLVTSRSWGHLRTDIWQGTQDLTTHFCGLLFSWFHAKTQFFLSTADFDTNISLSQQRKASSLTFIPHLKVKGWGDHWLFQVKQLEYARARKMKSSERESILGWL